MRNEILGVVTAGLTALAAHAQTPAFQEPMPIQGLRAYPAPYYVPSPVQRYPVYPQVSYPAYAPAAYPAQMPGGYPSGGYQSGGYPSGGLRPPLAMGPVVQARGQEALPLPTPVPARPPQNFPVPPETPAKPPSRESFEDSAPKQTAPPKNEVSDACPVSPASPEEPTEPYLVRPDSGWKPRKGYTLYGSLEYLFLREKRQPLPDNLSLTLSDPTAVPDLGQHETSGARVLLGVWLTDSQRLGFEGGYFFLAPRTGIDALNFGASPVAQLPIFAGIASESASLTSWTSFSGVESNFRYEAWRSRDGGCFRGYVDFLGGFRFVDLSESLTITSATMFGTAPVLFSNALLTTSDTFGTHNHLYAGQIGADAGFGWKRLTINGYTKLALGDNRETVSIAGITQVSAPPVLGNFTTPGGFFAQPSNTGKFRSDEFTLMPDVGVNFGYQVFERCRLAVGYNFMYLNNVVRPGNEVDVTAGGTRPPLFFLGGPRPTPAFMGFHETSFWAHGVNVMVELSY